LHVLSPCSTLCVEAVGMQSHLDSAQVSDLSVEERISQALPSLTAKQRRLARYMLDNEIDLAFASAEDVGRQAGVDAATVVRFSRMLGYEGYADLRDVVRRSVPQFLTAVERVTQRMSAGNSDDILQAVFAEDIRNLEKTARMNSPDILAQAVELLCAAPRVICIGHGISVFVADHLAHQLALIGVSVQRPSRSIVDGAIELTSLTDQDAVVVVSVWRYLQHTLLLAEAAQDRGANVVALTDSKAAPLSVHADITLTAATETPELGHSVAALITLTNVLVAGIAVASPDRTLDSLQRIDRFYEKFTVMADEPVSRATTESETRVRRRDGAKRKRR
jgi:DNA-binding MurR/RpiR family transcriptional regulator